MLYVGADACRAGWFAVILGEGSWKIDLFPDIVSLWRPYRDASLILLDIPIGLRDRGDSERSCDQEARRLLGARRASVFPAPCRPALYADIKQASAVNQQHTGRKLSEQTKGIIPRIREVDELLVKDKVARARIRETHPEVCFWALNHSQPMKHNKKKEAGFLERRRVLRRVYPDTDDIVAEARHRYPCSKVARDDILDALVVAVTAAAKKKGLSSIPETTELDSRQLRMEIVLYRR